MQGVLSSFGSKMPISAETVCDASNGYDILSLSQGGVTWSLGFFLSGELYMAHPWNTAMLPVLKNISSTPVVPLLAILRYIITRQGKQLVFNGISLLSGDHYLA